jgi:RNA polymerase primary sigma factor
LEQHCGGEPSLEEIAQGMAMTTEKVLETLLNSTSYVSLDEPYTDDERVRLFEVLESDWQPSPDAALLEESLQDEVDQMLATLKPREAEVIRMYFGLRGNLPQTLEQIGERFQLTRERVRQLREKALKHLRRQSSWELWGKYCKVKNANA